MTTIHLKYNTLKHILDEVKSNLSKKKSIILVKKRHVAYLSDILHFMVLDLCNIINAYCHEELKFGCWSDGRELQFTYKDYTIQFEYGPKSDTIDVIDFNSNSVRILHENADSILCNMNEYMKCEYGKHMYINTLETKSKYYTKNSIYVRKHNYLSTYGYNHKKIYNDILNALIIRNHKKFKLDIVMTKCILHGVYKYYKKLITTKS